MLTHVNNYVIIIGIVISGNERIHQINSSVAITCSSDLAVQTIRWLNNSDNGQELISNSGQQQLLLPIESVTSNLDSTMYTCEMQVVLATVVETVQVMFTFQATSKSVCFHNRKHSSYGYFVQINLLLVSLLLYW